MVCSRSGSRGHVGCCHHRGVGLLWPPVFFLTWRERNRNNRVAARIESNCLFPFVRKRHEGFRREEKVSQKGRDRQRLRFSGVLKIARRPEECQPPTMTASVCTACTANALNIKIEHGDPKALRNITAVSFIGSLRCEKFRRSLCVGSGTYMRASAMASNEGTSRN
jgi:hypothetical protein